MGQLTRAVAGPLQHLVRRNSTEEPTRRRRRTRQRGREPMARTQMGPRSDSRPDSQLRRRESPRPTPTDQARRYAATARCAARRAGSRRPDRGRGTAAHARCQVGKPSIEKGVRRSEPRPGGLIGVWRQLIRPPEPPHRETELLPPFPPREVRTMGLRARAPQELRRRAQEAASVAAATGLLALAKPTGLELARAVRRTGGVNDSKVFAPHLDGASALGGGTTHRMISQMT